MKIKKLVDNRKNIVYNKKKEEGKN
jgi:hypothetical protein